MKTAILLLATASAIASTIAGAQSMFRGDAAHTGTYRAEAPRQFHRVKWRSEKDVRSEEAASWAAHFQWLEAEIDRKAAGHANPGSIVLHRLNRTEYANVIHDLLEIEIDPATLLPTDDSARGFDNVAGSLTISPTLLEAYTTAATRIARMAVGFWKSPTAANYIAPGDTSQNQHIDGLPLGTRGGMLVTHNFPADGEARGLRLWGGTTGIKSDQS